MIRNILFDMGGIIFTQDMREAARRFRRIGLDTDKYMGEFAQQGFLLDIEKGTIDCETFCRMLEQVTGRGHISFSEARHCWLGYVRDVPVARLHTLESLRGKYTLGLASNTNPFVMDYADSPGFSTDGKPVSAYFDFLFTSFTMGICKPSPEYFEEAMRIGGMLPEETLFFDDSLANVAGACSVGIRGIHIPQNEDWTPVLYQELAKK